MLISLLKQIFGSKPVERDLPLIAELKRLAANNDPEGMCLLGDSYYSGKLIRKNEKVALDWYRKAAELGHSGAQIRIGDDIIKDSVEDPNIPNANVWYERALKNATIEDKLRLGRNFIRTWQAEKAFPLLLEAANHGLPEAQSMMAHVYKYGSGVEKNEVKSFEWQSKAAKQGYPGALLQLGHDYRGGVGVQANQELAFECFRDAAVQGDANALYQLAICYENGLGTPQDKSKALAANLKAAELGDCAARNRVGLSRSVMDRIRLNL